MVINKNLLTNKIFKFLMRMKIGFRFDRLKKLGHILDVVGKTSMNRI
jgi:hypothetical protein